MKKVGGHRNFGYGKQMDWAGRQALRDRYGNGHYGTVAGHAERWRRFATWCRDEREIRDAQSVDTNIVEDYGRSLNKEVAAGMSPAYAQNLLSTVNVVLESMRCDQRIRVAPAAFVGQRSRTRTDPPAGLDRKIVRQCADQLRENGHKRVAALVEIARALGLRLPLGHAGAARARPHGPAMGSPRAVPREHRLGPHPPRQPRCRQRPG